MGGKILPIGRQELPEAGMACGSLGPLRPTKINIFQMLRKALRFGMQLAMT